MNRVSAVLQLVLSARPHQARINRFERDFSLAPDVGIAHFATKQLIAHAQALAMRASRYLITERVAQPTCALCGEVDGLAGFNGL
jgi:hypothetical protein